MAALADDILEREVGEPSERMVCESIFYMLEGPLLIRPTPHNVAEFMVEAGWASDLAEALGRIWESVLDPDEPTEVYLPDSDCEWTLWVHPAERERLWRRHDFGRALARRLGEERYAAHDYTAEDVVLAWTEVIAT